MPTDSGTVPGGGVRREPHPAAVDQRDAGEDIHGKRQAERNEHGGQGG